MLTDYATLLNHSCRRRDLLAAGSVPFISRCLPTASTQKSASTVELAIRKHTRLMAGRSATVVSANNIVPGPTLRFREGERVTIRVRNEMEENTSIHWHGLVVPRDMDGVPGVSFAGIPPKQTFTYQFRLRQSGTYWYHSHSGGQEQMGLYGPFIVDPIRTEPYTYDREYVVLLSDWTYENPRQVADKIKKNSDYYNFQQQTVGDFLHDAKQHGFRKTVEGRAKWAKMRMSPTDLLDVTGHAYQYIANGLSREENWTGLFKPGERVRLRFINAGAMTVFDVRIPGLTLTVVQADGQDVMPVEVEEFRIGSAETYDVIVEPGEDKAYTIFAEAMDRSGFAVATLTSRSGMRGDIPARRKRPLRGMGDMGMAMNMAHAGMIMPAGTAMRTSEQMGQHNMSIDQSALPAPTRHGPNHGPGNAGVPAMSRSRVSERGTGLEDTPWRVLVYSDLKRLRPAPEFRMPQHTVELHLTGNMERQMWSINGRKYSQDSKPIPLRLGETTRIFFVNDTMMDHPMHLHGMWMVLENGTGAYRPNKHTILVKPAERLAVYVTPDEPGNFAFHCHFLFHMELGMFRVVNVSENPA